MRMTYHNESSKMLKQRSTGIKDTGKLPPEELEPLQVFSAATRLTKVRLIHK